MPLNVTVLSVADTDGVEFRAASSAGFTDGEIAASALITRAPNIGARMPGFPGLTGGLERSTSSGALALDHSLPPEGGAERFNSEWLTAPLQGQTAILYSQTLADTIPDLSRAPDLSDPSWNQIPLKIKGLKQDGDEIIIEWLPASDELDVDIRVPVFSGGGNGVLILGALLDHIEWTNGNNGGALEPSLTGDWYYELSGAIIDTGDLGTNNQRPIEWSAGTDGIVLGTNNGGNANVRGRVFQGAVATSATTANDVLVESRRPVAFGFGRDTALDVIYVTVDGERLVSTPFTGTIDDNSGGGSSPLIVGENTILSAVAEFRIWNITPSAELLKSFANKPMDPFNPPAGLVEFFRVGSGSGNQAVWDAVIDSGNDSTGNAGSADFRYGGQGQPEHDGFSFPTTAGQVFGLLPQVVDPADIVFGLHFETVTDVSAWFRADEFLSFTANSPFTGDVTVDTKPQTDFGLSEVRWDFTGDPVADYEALILYFLTTSNVGPVPPGDIAIPFVVGPVLDQAAGFHVKPSLTGVASSKAPAGVEGQSVLNPTVAKSLAELCRGAGVVLTKTPAAEWEAIRVPPEPFALTDPHFELRETGGEEGDFSTAGISVTGAVQLNVQDEQTVAFKRFIDPLENPTLGSGGAEPLDISRSVLPFLTAKFLRDQEFRDEFPGSEAGAVVQSHFIIKDDAFKEASRRGFSLLAVGSPPLRPFKIKLSRVPEPGVLQLGAKVVIFTTQHKPLTGIPCFVTSYSSGGFTGPTTTGGVIELMEMGRWRLAPDAYLESTDLTAPDIANIQDDAMLQDSATSDSFTFTTAGNRFRVSFPTPSSLKPGGRHLLRWQFSQDDGSLGFGRVELFEAGSRVENFPPLEIQGHSQKFDGDRIVTIGEFVTEDLADTTGADIECRCPILEGPIEAVFAVDLVYEYDR